MFKRILAPLDGSSFAESVLPTVEMLAQCGNGEIELMRVAVHPSTYAYVADAAVLNDLYDRDHTHCDEYLKRVADELSARVGLCPHIAVLEGAVADSIIDYAAQTDSDLIVMSTHGRTGVERWLLGSVAERVVHGTKVPVLLIRPQNAQPAEAAHTRVVEMAS